jgi:hypothetical protein
MRFFGAFGNICYRELKNKSFERIWDHEYSAPQAFYLFVFVSGLHCSYTRIQSSRWSQLF